MDLYLQYDLSIYHTIKDDGYFYSEGNCWIISAFHVLQYLAKTKYTDMYSDDIVTSMMQKMKNKISIQNILMKMAIVKKRQQNMMEL